MGEALSRGKPRRLKGDIMSPEKRSALMVHIWEHQIRRNLPKALGRVEAALDATQGTRGKS